MAFEVVDRGYDFSALSERMQWYIDSEILGCCASVVVKNGEVVHFNTQGYRDVESADPLAPDAIFRMYSNTKLVTSVAAMILVEDGRLELDAPLAKYLPEFSDISVLKSDAQSVEDVEPVKSPPTVRQAMSHSAGLSYGFIEPMSVVDQAYAAIGIDILGDRTMTLAGLSQKVASVPLAYQPGSAWRYSFGTDILARLIEVASGEAFDDFLSQHIFAPLAMPDTGFHVPQSQHGRLVSMYAAADLLDPMKPGLPKVDSSESGQYLTKPSLLSGGGGLVSTISDYLRFLLMLRSGGSLDGVRIVSEDSVRAMRTNELQGDLHVSFPMWAMPGTVFGLGFAIRESLTDDDHPSALGEYFWGGMAGTHSFFSPKADLIGFNLTQRMPGYWHPFSHDWRSEVYRVAG
ncbi:MAG: beta-lactamase family protein [Pseudomonadaceae bacterium]|nr:beta-lactamase family protein [Pseudomonadaceae bacterium]